MVISELNKFNILKIKVLMILCENKLTFCKTNLVNFVKAIIYVSK